MEDPQIPPNKLPHLQLTVQSGRGLSTPDPAIAGLVLEFRWRIEALARQSPSKCRTDGNFSSPSPCGPLASRRGTLVPIRLSLSTNSAAAMICRACLRVRPAAVRAGQSQRPHTLQRAGRTQLLHLSSTTSPRRIPRGVVSLSASPQSSLSSPAQRPFSASAAAQEQESVSTSASPLIEKPDSLSEGESQIWDRLVEELSPTQLVVQDVSGGCGSMYAIDISAERFRGLNMLKQQRLVNSALGDMVKQWHGVQLRTRIP